MPSTQTQRGYARLVEVERGASYRRGPCDRDPGRWPRICTVEAVLYDVANVHNNEILRIQTRQNKEKNNLNKDKQRNFYDQLSFPFPCYRSHRPVFCFVLLHHWLTSIFLTKGNKNCSWVYTKQESSSHMFRKLLYVLFQKEHSLTKSLQHNNFSLVNNDKTQVNRSVPSRSSRLSYFTN